MPSLYKLRKKTCRAKISLAMRAIFFYNIHILVQTKIDTFIKIIRLYFNYTLKAENELVPLIVKWKAFILSLNQTLTGFLIKKKHLKRTKNQLFNFILKYDRRYLYNIYIIYNVMFHKKILIRLLGANQDLIKLNFYNKLFLCSLNKPEILNRSRTSEPIVSSLTKTISKNCQNKINFEPIYEKKTMMANDRQRLEKTPSRSKRIWKIACLLDE
ncbi:hypothetical protein BpHYR1_020568 [Brachionus plicatilis]|uniref:Uncharacterized protein n=1 Tax=Brachionus plicatilis TaxID=10195 RepID=A0A3M7QI67_BRAPC|nr:hypothetical protein BpHYR1_020568 [Brachionus plicatilis]